MSYAYKMLTNPLNYTKIDTLLIVDMKVRLTVALDKRGFVCVWHAGQSSDPKEEIPPLR